MTVAIISGVSSGALHAVTGPDHLLSLGPAALNAPPKTAVRIGLFWGMGHALGTLILSLPLLLLAQWAHVSHFASWGDRLAGLALVAMALWSWRGASRVPGQSSDTRSPFWVGLLHGITGAGALLLVLPNALGGDSARALVYLGAFALGSTVAMAGLTRAIGKVGRRLDQRHLRSLQRVLLSGAVALGTTWLVLG